MSENTELQNAEQTEDNEEVFEDEQEEYVYTESKVVTLLKRIFNKKVIAVGIAVVVLIQVLTSVIVSGLVLDADKFIKSEKSEKIIYGELSDKSYVEWLSGKATVCHPMTFNAEDMAVYAYHFYDLGFNVILPDARGYGESEYKKLNMGWLDRHDILLWAEEIVKTDSKANIFLFGVGMGGSTVLMASSLELPANVKGIISDSAYADVHGAFKENIKDIYGVPPFPVVNMASLYVKLTEGWSFKEADAIEQVKNSKVPILFIHGGEDEVVPVSQSNDLYESCSAKGSDHLLISGALHAKTLETNAEKYWSNVDLFILDNIEDTP